MRAKEYLNQLDKRLSEGEEIIHAVSNILVEIFIEGKQLILNRHCETDAATLAVFNELNQKAKVFVRLVNDKKYPFEQGHLVLLDTAFEKTVNILMPELYMAWKFLQDMKK
jgi:hypothetical protein